MVEIEKPRISCFDSAEDPSYGKYVVEPLERGYGMTLGNSLRRILLSSLPGYAATSVKIQGVQHEFSTIPGVTEDVTEIVLAVKRIIPKLHTPGVKTVHIDAVGPCEVTAGDIKADADVEILNPELHICTLGEDATFNMEITLSQGRGYVSSDRNKTPQTVIGVIPIDSIYSPVTKVNYTVEPTRVGDRTDYDKLTLEVWTDSTISAKDAVSLGAKILSDHLTVFTNLSDAVTSSSTVVEKVADHPDAKLSMTIDELDHVDLAIDGVDEIDPQFNAIKGGGGALYREKVVASMAKEVIWIMDESKLVEKISAFHLPVEIAQYGSKQAMERMTGYGWNPVLRVRDGKTFVTDNGNYIADLHLGAGFDIQDVYSKLTGMLGVLEHGLFLNMCKRMIVGHSDGTVDVIENPSK